MRGFPACIRRFAGACGLTCWARPMKPLLYLIPLWVLATGNLWGGVRREALRSPDLGAVLTMVLAAFLEELVFRGLLFRFLRKRVSPAAAVIVSALVFGLFHGLNLLSGQSLLYTAGQVLFAAAWGVLFATVFWKGGSLLPCVLAHAFLNVTALFTAAGPRMTGVMIGVTVLLGGSYCLYLAKLQIAEDMK